MNDETTNIEQIQEEMNLTENPESAATEAVEVTMQEEVKTEATLFDEQITETPEEPVAETISETPVIEETIPAAQADVVIDEAPVAEIPAAVAETVTEANAEVVDAAPLAETQADANAEKEEKQAKERINNQEKIDAIYKELVEIKEQNGFIDVEIKGRIRGGLRAIYKEMPLFLPASHYSLKRTPTEQELTEAIGKTYKVQIHELQEYDEGRKAVIVSRKSILMEDFWNNIHVNDQVEGKVSSIAPFGVFLDLGGVEGLIHISRLSQVHVDDPNKFLKKGDSVKAIVVELDKNKNRIALSRKELEESPWKDAEAVFSPGTQHKGIVRRLTDFGAYVELKPGVDGLLRTPEISWTKRVKRPADVLKPGQEISVEILSVSEEKQTVSLSYKKTQPNPWSNLVDKYPVGTVYQAKVLQVMPQGCIISIDEDLDGFMPRSKMKGVLQGNKIPFHPGDSISVSIADLIPDEESLILSPVIDNPSSSTGHDEEKRSYSNPKKEQANIPQQREAITFGDYLSDIDKKSLFNTLGE